MSKVLIVEPHPYHYEVLPSVAYYFARLNYDITILTRENFQSDDLFLSFPKKYKVRFITYSGNMLKRILFQPEIAEYDFVFFNSLEYWHDGKRERLLDYLGGYPASKYGIMGIYHNPSMINFKDDDLLREKRIFGLTSYSIRGYDVPLLAGCYFGEFSNDKKENISTTRLLMIGNTNKSWIAEMGIANSNARDLDFRINNISSEKKNRLIWKHVDHYIKNKVRLITGKGIKYHNESLSALRKINFLGKLSFQEMFKCLIDTDYVLIAIDMDKEENQDFLNGKTSGSKQLALAFGKPCFINDKLTKAFQLPPNAVVTFSNNNLCEAINKIPYLNTDKYSKMCLAMREYRDEAIAVSLDNLHTSVSKNTCGSVTTLPINLTEYSFAFFCKTYRDDLARFSNMLESFHKHNLQDVRMFVSCPEKELSLFKKYASDTVEIITDESYASNYMVARGEDGLSKGYINQEICKLSFWEISSYDNYCCIDSDSEFIRDFYYSDFMYDAKTPYSVLVQDKDLSCELNYQKYWDYRYRKIKDIFDFMHYDGDIYKTCHGFQIMNNKVLTHLKHYLLEHDFDYAKAITYSPFEFTWYNAALQKFNDIDIYEIEPLFKCFHTEREYMLSIIKNQNADDWARSYVGLILNSNWHRGEACETFWENVLRLIGKCVNKIVK
ncbi:hypothetical protein SAMN05216582_10787 [Selenomonas ruminantium]|uniref:Uncharacterized protein n=1 Tax=Selenomonas ruminantium TaxID=971 RepID=A0A1M6TF51_SELRU|nr:DUF6492 family protein [Selenomonas ruminantium]SHK55398.1 hypothetical protein SAMN05216582_10787 [Selenomonas ruminantium]